jgi:hypothetical protein
VLFVRLDDLQSTVDAATLELLGPLVSNMVNLRTLILQRCGLQTVRARLRVYPVVPACRA